LKIDSLLLFIWLKYQSNDGGDGGEEEKRKDENSVENGSLMLER
jgi:hypothetical protein